MAFQTGVTFDDGIISIDKLQKICQNDEEMYSEIVAKPFGILALGERTTTFTNTATGTQETVLDSVYVDAPTDNRLVVVHVYIPQYGIVNALDSHNGHSGSVLYVFRDAEQVSETVTMNVGSLTPRFTHYFSFMDVIKKKSQCQYKLKILGASISSRQTLICSKTHPLQIWVEDWGVYSGTDI